MTEATQAHESGDTENRSAVGRLTLVVEVGHGTETVTYERRWPGPDEARRWCEEKVAHAPAGATVLEIQVIEEVWGRRHAWEATASRHIPETLQLGMRTGTGAVTWGEAHEVGTDAVHRRVT